MKKNTIYIMINFFVMSGISIAFIIGKNYVLAAACFLAAQMWLIADYIKNKP